MSKSARVRSLISSLFLFSTFVGVSVVEILVAWFSRGRIQTSWFILVSLSALVFYSLAYFLSNRVLHRKLKRHQITADDYSVEIRIPTIVYAVGCLSFIFLLAQLLPTSTFFEYLFNGHRQTDIYHYLSLDSIFAYEINTYAHQYLENSTWIFNSNLFTSIVGSVTLVFELLIAIQSQKKAETNRAH